MNRIYTVKFRYEATIHYFSSIKAIFDIFTPEQIGCNKHNLYNKGVPKGKDYLGKKCNIRLGWVNKK